LEIEQAVAPSARAGLINLSAFDSPGYRLLWIGTLASFATNPLRFSAGILFLTNSAPDDVRFLLAGVLGAISGGVTLIFGIVGGALADRFERRRLLIAAQVVLIGATVGVGLTMTLDVDALSLVLFFTFIFIGAAALSVDMPARQALVAEVVPPGLLANAVALDSVAMMMALPIALPLSGLLIDELGYGGAYGCAAIGYGIALLTLLPLRYQPIARRRQQKLMFLADVRQGLEYVAGAPAVLWTLALFFILMALAFPLVASFGPVWVTEVLDLSATEFGFFAAAWGLGAIGASLVMTSVGHFPAKGWLLICAVIVFSVLVLVWAYSRSVPLSAVVNFSLGASFTVIQISARSLIQRAVPFDLQGRVMSLLMMNLAVANIAALLVGGLAQATSLELVTAVLGWTAFALVILVVVTRPAIRRIGEMSAATA
jgi:MFS family permease